MLTEIIFIYKDLKDREAVEKIESNKGLFITFMDYDNRKSKKHSWELMEDWGARQLPFALLKEGDKVIKGLYTEDGNHVIKDLKKYL